jgi:hypothetical protein
MAIAGNLRPTPDARKTAALLPNDFAVELPALGQQHFWSMNGRSDPPSAQTSEFL